MIHNKFLQSYDAIGLMNNLFGHIKKVEDNVKEKGGVVKSISHTFQLRTNTEPGISGKGAQHTATVIVLYEGEKIEDF